MKTLGDQCKTSEDLYKHPEISRCYYMKIFGCFVKNSINSLEVVKCGILFAPWQTTLRDFESTSFKKFILYILNFNFQNIMNN